MKKFRIYPCISQAALKILSGQSLRTMDQTVKHNGITSLSAPGICQKYGEYDWEGECIALYDREQVNALVRELTDAGFEPKIVEGDGPAPELARDEQELNRRIRTLSSFEGLSKFHIFYFPEYEGENGPDGFPGLV